MTTTFSPDDENQLFQIKFKNLTDVCWLQEQLGRMALVDLGGSALSPWLMAMLSQGEFGIFVLRKVVEDKYLFTSLDDEDRILVDPTYLLQAHPISFMLIDLPQVDSMTLLLPTGELRLGEEVIPPQGTRRLFEVLASHFGMPVKDPQFDLPSPTTKLPQEEVAEEDLEFDDDMLD